MGLKPWPILRGNRDLRSTKEMVYTIPSVAAVDDAWGHAKLLCKTLLLSVVLAYYCAESAQAATLRLGPPTVENERISIAIFLEGDAQEAPAAIDFRLRYDPAVLEVLGAEAGTQAQEAGKRLMANVPVEGQYVVLIMNFNQQTIAPGHVATVRLAQIGNAVGSTTQLQLAAPTLSTVEGVAIPVEGSELSVPLTAHVADEPDAPETDDPAGDDAPTAPEGPEKSPGAVQPEAEAPGDWMAGPATVPVEDGASEPDQQTLSGVLEEADRARSAIVPPVVPGQSARPLAEQPGLAAAEADEREPALDERLNAVEVPSTVDFAGQPAQNRDEKEISKPEVEDGTASSVSPPGTVPVLTKRILTGVAVGVLIVMLFLRRRLVR
jgi:hypothetical protein